MLGKNLRRLAILAVPAALTFAAASAVHAQVYTPTQATLLSIVDESSGFGDGGHVNSVTADGNGGVIVSLNFDQATAKGGNDGKNPWVPFDVTYFSGGLDLSAFSDSEVSVSLLAGSGDAAVDVQPFIQGGSPNFSFYGFSGAPGEVFPQRGGAAVISDSVLASQPGSAAPGNIRWGFQVFPQPTFNGYDPAGTPAELIEIDPVAVPEPASIGLLGLAIPALLARRRNASK